MTTAERLKEPDGARAAREALIEARGRLLDIHHGLDMNTPESLALAFVTTEMRYQLARLGVEVEPRHPRS